MKRFFSFFVASLFICISAFAQQQMTPLNLVKQPAISQKQTQTKARKASLKTNQHVVGLYDTDDVTWDYGIGSGEYEIGTIIPADRYNDFENATIDAIRFSISCEALLYYVAIYTVNNGNLNRTPIAQEYIYHNCPSGWNTIELSSPISVPQDAEGLMVCYDFLSVSGTYPLSTHDIDSPSLYIGGNDLSDKGYGTACIQLIVSEEEHPVYIKNSDIPTTAINKLTTINVGIVSGTNVDIESIEYDVEFEGNTTTYTENVNIPASSKESYPLPFYVTPSQTGKIQGNITIKKINDVEVAPITKHFYVNVVTRVVPRYSIVEEITGTSVGYFATGYVADKIIMNEFSDKAGIISLHSWNSSEPLYPKNYHTPKFEAAPSFIYNRAGTPQDGNFENVRATLSALDNSVPEVAVTVEAKYTDDSRTSIAASASTEFLTDLPGSELVFVLTANELASSSWKQLNFYYNNNSSTYPELADFCKGGVYGQSSISNFPYDNVMISSSWPSATDANQVAAFSTTNAGDIETSEFTIPMPTKSTVLAAIKPRKLFVTAMVIKKDGTIANAARCRVMVPVSEQEWMQYNGLLNAIKAYNFSDHIGEYLLPNKDLATTLSTIAMWEETFQNRDDKKYDDNLEAIKYALTNMKPNLPRAGQMLFFKGATSGKYIAPDQKGGCMLNNLDDKGSPENAEASANSLFYYDGKHLIQYYFPYEFHGIHKRSGLYMSNNNIDVYENASRYESSRDVIKFDSSSTIKKGSYRIMSGDYTYVDDYAESGYVQYASKYSSNYTNTALYDWYIEESPYCYLFITEAGYATLCLPIAVELDTDQITAYTLTENGNGRLDAHPIENGIVPANTPVVVKAAPGNYVLNIYEGEIAENPQFAENVLLGTFGRMATPSNSLVLSMNGDELGFYNYKEKVLDGFKAYYIPSTDNTSNGRSIYFDDILEGISDIFNTEAEMVFDLQGRRMNQYSKGVYIVNGKKVIK